MSKNALIVQELDPRQKVFVDAYLTDFNLNAATRKAGVDERTGYHWLKKNASVKHAIMDNVDKITQRCDVTMEEVLNEYKRIAFFDQASYIEGCTHLLDNGEVKLSIEDFRNLDGRALKKVTYHVDPSGVTHVTVIPHDKIMALNALEDYLRFSSNNKPPVKISAEDLESKSASDIANSYQQMLAE